MNASDLNNEDFVTMQIPKRLMRVVVQAMADAWDQEGPSKPVSDFGLVVGTSGYTEADIRAVRREVTNASVSKVMDYLAKRPGKPVGFSELAKVAGRPHLGLRGDMAGFTKSCTRARGGRGEWPLLVQWDATVPGQGGRGELTYRMEPDIARWWLNA